MCDFAKPARPCFLNRNLFLQLGLSLMCVIIFQPIFLYLFAFTPSILTWTYDPTCIRTSNQTMRFVSWGRSFVVCRFLPFNLNRSSIPKRKHCNFMFYKHITLLICDYRSPSTRQRPPDLSAERRVLPRAISHITQLILYWNGISAAFVPVAEQCLIRRLPTIDAKGSWITYLYMSSDGTCI